MPAIADPNRTRLAVLGSPIAHSLSPTLHAAAYEVLGLPFEYGRVEVASGTLGDFLAECEQDSGQQDAGEQGAWRGLSLTMPLKRELIPYLDRTTPLVDELGVANTLLFRTEGSTTVKVGANTDVDGLVRPVEALGHVPGEATILGGGATAASALYASVRLGAQLVRVFLRDTKKAGPLVDLAVRTGVTLEVHPLTALADSQPHGFVISTLPGDAAAGLPVVPSGPDAVLFDVSYDPWPSSLGGAWASAGGRVLNGLDMLSEQAIGQVRLFVGGDVDQPLPDEAAVRRAMREAVGLPPVLDA